MAESEIMIISNAVIAFSTFIGVIAAIASYLKQIINFDIWSIMLILTIYILIVLIIIILIMIKRRQ